MEIKQEKYYKVIWADYRSKYTPSIKTLNDLSWDGMTDLLQKRDLSSIQWKIGILYIKKGALADSDDLSLLKDIWIDFCPNVFALPIMSQRMKDIVDANLTGNENVYWVPLNVEANGEIRQYYILQFESRILVLDKRKSIFWNDFLGKAVFSKKKVTGYSIVSDQHDVVWQTMPTFYINAAIRRQFMKAKITGISYSPVEVV